MPVRCGLYHGLRGLAVLVLFPLLLSAQSEKAQLTGTITDNSGALVPGVEIRVTNVATGEKRTAVSNEAGLWTVPLLEPGKYEIASSRQGFRSVTRTNIELHVNQTMRVDLALEVGALLAGRACPARFPRRRRPASAPWCRAEGFWVDECWPDRFLPTDFWSTGSDSAATNRELTEFNLHYGRTSHLEKAECGGEGECQLQQRGYLADSVRI
jgi:hypothetical protein